jgi:hypothetical protein
MCDQKDNCNNSSDEISIGSSKHIEAAMERLKNNYSIDQMDRHFDGDNETYRFENARVIIIGFSYSQLTYIRSLLQKSNVRTISSTSNVYQLSKIGEMGAAFSHIIIDIDAFDGLATGVDALLSFRQKYNHIVLLCSASVTKDDFGTERLVICDASLRLPLSLSRLRNGLNAAIANNRERFRRPTTAFYGT